MKVRGIEKKQREKQKEIYEEKKQAWRKTGIGADKTQDT